jgi:succinate dehydrogenase / fumarate reductase cytochrome b subunit
MFKTTGFVSFLFRRISGLALVFYLFTHMWVIGSINQGAEVFDMRLGLVQTTFFKFAEVALLAAVIYHAFDGVRLLIVHYFGVTEYRKSLFYAMFVIFILVTVAGGLPIILFALEG